MTATRQALGRGEATRLLASVADLASTAGARILVIAAQGAAPRTKPDMSPVTAADDAAEEILSAGLAQLLPGVPIVAEEAVSRGDKARPRGTYLLVDPIDGTREMIAGRGEYTVNIALVEAGVPVLGIVYAPALQEIYAGAEGRALRAALAPGHRFEPDRAETIRTRPRPARLLAMVSRSHPDRTSDEFLARLPVEKKIPLGSSLKFARLAEGAADVYARLTPVNEWDIAAGHALLAAAGGSVTKPDGSALTFGMRETGFRIDGFVAWGDVPKL
ncbi:MAG: inositol monophosphatase family protein [Xanthobacteraceae bacterium]